MCCLLFICCQLLKILVNFRFVNDSDNPNAKMKIVMMYGLPKLCLFASETILKGDEIVYDYGVENLPWREKVKQIMI